MQISPLNGVVVNKMMIIPIDKRLAKVNTLWQNSKAKYYKRACKGHLPIGKSKGHSYYRIFSFPGTNKAPFTVFQQYTH